MQDEPPWIELSRQLELLRADVEAIKLRLDQPLESTELSEWERTRLHDDIELGGFSAEDSRAIQVALGVQPTEPGSVALVDWTAVRNSCLLLEGVEPSEYNELHLDPFLALADLASLAGAVIFYDRVLVLTDSEWAWRINHNLGLIQERPVVPLDLTSIENGSNLLHDKFLLALQLLNTSTSDNAVWLEWLSEAWTKLLPGLSFPSHDANSYSTELGVGREALEYDHEYGSASPDRIDLLTVFKPARDSWRISEDSLRKIVLDNDLRAIFYEDLAASLSRALSEGQGGPSVSYVGGCLRSPMLLARAKYAEASFRSSTPVQNWLQDQWRARYQPRSAPLRMPFWMDAILSLSGTRSDVVATIRDMRNRARPLRKTRGRLDEALRTGDSKVIDQLLNVIKGDLDTATEPFNRVADIAAESVHMAAQSVLPAVASDLSDTLVRASVDSNFVKKLSLRLFRPHLRFILSMRTDAAAREKSLTKAADIFGWPQAFAAEPLAFLQRLTEIAWIA